VAVASHQRPTIEAEAIPEATAEEIAEKMAAFQNPKSSPRVRVLARVFLVEQGVLGVRQSLEQKVGLSPVRPGVPGSSGQRPMIFGSRPVVAPCRRPSVDHSGALADEIRAFGRACSGYGNDL
jgi:hypothetical protein